MPAGNAEVTNCPKVRKAPRLRWLPAASKGIGSAVSFRLSEMGARIAVNYNTSEKEAREVVRTIETRGGEAFAVHADVSDCGQGRGHGGKGRRQMGPHRHPG